MDRNETTSKVSVLLQPHQEELIQLTELAGIHANPLVFRLIIELLNMQVDQAAIFKLLKTIRRSSRSSKRRSTKSSKTNSN